MPAVQRAVSRVRHRRPHHHRRARRRQWIVNGQKVWNTSAHHADLGMLLARTDWDAPKHAGISYLVLPMHQPGVEVRPIRQMNNHDSFNEVFMTDARVPRDWVVGQVNQGWAAALATLAHERRLARCGGPGLDGVDPGLALDKPRPRRPKSRGSTPGTRSGPAADLVIEHARSMGVTADPLIRQEIARLITLQLVSQWTAERAQAGTRKRSAAGPGGVDREARREQHRAAGGQGALDDRRRERAPRGRGAARPAQRAARGDHPLSPRPVHRGRH